MQRPRDKQDDADGVQPGRAEAARLAEHHQQQGERHRFDEIAVATHPYTSGPKAALLLLEPLEPALSAYQPFHASRADFFRRLGAFDQARVAYAEAIRLSQHPFERRFLETRLDALPG